MNNITDLLTPDSFRAWLASKQPDETVGLTECGSACPLAKFFRASGFKHAWVEAHDILLYGGVDYGPVTALPDWACEFVARVDCLSLRRQVPVSAQKAIELLDRAVAT